MSSSARFSAGALSATLLGVAAAGGISHLDQRMAAQANRLHQFELADSVGVAPAVGPRFRTFVKDRCLVEQAFPPHRFPGVHPLVLKMDEPLVKDFNKFLKASGGGEHEFAIRASEFAFGVERVLKPGEKQISLKELTCRLNSIRQTELPVAFPETHQPNASRSPEYSAFVDDAEAERQIHDALMSYPGLAKRLVSHFTHGHVTVK